MKRTLTITLNSDWRKTLRQAGKSIAKGISSGQYQGEFLNFESTGVFFGKLTERRWNIVHVLQAEGKTGVRELARLVERDVRRVHDDVTALIELGLIEKTADGKLVCPYSDIHVDMHLVAA